MKSIAPLLGLFLLSGCTSNEPLPPHDSIQTPSIAPSKGEFQRVVDKHNKIRNEHYRGNHLSWSQTLANSAQKHADYLARTNSFTHSDSGYGENLYASSGNLGMVDAVDGWILEKNKFDLRTKQCRGDWSACGHYTQMIWQSTTKIGCGLSRGSQWKTIVVCQYDPRGNYTGVSPY